MNIQEADFLVFALICVAMSFYVLSEILLILQEKGSMFFLLFIIVITPITQSTSKATICIGMLAVLTFLNYYDLTYKSNDTDINIDININIKSRDNPVIN